jgi:hypothetical protein
MKIHQLPQGARFEYEGEEYVKTGPLFATGKGGQRLIPKYAVLKPLGAIGATPVTAASGSISRAAVLEGFATFYTECKTLVPEGRQSMLDAARDRFLRVLD